jgi:hypothetical protein
VLPGNKKNGLLSPGNSGPIIGRRRIGFAFMNANILDEPGSYSLAFGLAIGRCCLLIGEFERSYSLRSVSMRRAVAAADNELYSSPLKICRFSKSARRIAIATIICVGFA